MDSVEVHAVFIDQFDPNDDEELQLRDGLVAAFRYWAEHGHHPDFGRDVTYRDPAGSVVPKVGLRHVHLRPDVQEKRAARIWNDPSADPYDKKSDRHLVYVRSDEQDRLLIYYFDDGGHEGARGDFQLLKALGRAAEEWLRETKRYPDTDD